MDNRCGSGHASLAAESEEAAQTFGTRRGAAAADSAATTGQPDATGRAAPTGRHADTGIAVADAGKRPATARTEASSRPANAPRKPRSPKQTQAQRMGSRTETRANQSTTAAAGQRPAGTPAQEPAQEAQFGPQEESDCRGVRPAPGRDLFGYSEAQIRRGIDGTQATDSGRPRARDGRPGQVATTLPPGSGNTRQRQEPTKTSPDKGNTPEYPKKEDAGSVAKTRGTERRPESKVLSPGTTQRSDRKA